MWLRIDGAQLADAPLFTAPRTPLPRAKKFGAFSGVFTPSILTILGVIMYLRLPSIVGQAGLVQTLLIIAVAHVISIATGLSVSSIATDKKVRAGGTYYMISRSLGLPIGGTLGLALFVGLSFSVSLYLIGFSESFLAYVGLPADRNAIRIAGTTALIGVTIVTLISTALALKTQYYIMAAIALSLLSILFGRHDFTPAEPLVRPAATAAPFIVLFGIFFPAVTGFEAGVSMSGDLSDPKRAIPKGTMAAIAVGLVVYIGLAAFLALTVNAQQLAGNPRVLLDIALFPPLVVAGIWGATISSAFGSILGAPRILQATSVDGITPRWFARGYGRENEPRHALVLAFVIAEAGILIGELDAIARIVSMFFITTYGFLNLTAAIEARVSPDFRPDFRVPAWIALVGAVACFVVMIQLDFPAMVGATVLLGGIYLYLKRKQLRLETGDTWEGVWSAMARGALARLHRTDTHRRNWRPNILLFGGAAARPHLVDFARQLTTQRGVLTNVEVVGDDDAGAAVPDRVVSRAAGDGALDVFTRRVRGPDVYATIEQVARHYGFAGFEPNTVLLGRARSPDPTRFTQLLQALVEQDLNVLLLDYDHARGWGRRERIDVWWRLAGNDVAFSLALVRFLTTSDDWRHARVRFLTVNDADAALSLPIGRDVARVLAEHRLEADVRVINNALLRRSFVDIVRAESVEADLTVLGMADMRRDDASRFIADTHALADVLGTALLVHASSFFHQPLIESAALTARRPAGPPAGAAAASEPAPPPLALPDGEPLPALLTRLDAALQESVGKLFDDYLGRSYALNRSALVRIGAFAAESAIDAVRAHPRNDDAARAAGARFLQAALEQIGALREATHTQRALLAGAVEWLPARVAGLAEAVPARVDVRPPPEAWSGRAREPAAAALARLRARVWSALRRRAPTYRTPLRALAHARLEAFASLVLQDGLEAFAADAYRTTGAGGRLMASALARIDAVARHRGADAAELDAVVDSESIRSDAATAERAAAVAAHRARVGAAAAARAAVNAIAEDAARFDGSRALRAARRWRANGIGSRPDLEAAQAWAEVQELATAEAELAIRLSDVADRVASIARMTREAIGEHLDREVIEPLEAQRTALVRAAEQPSRAPAAADAAGQLDALLQPDSLVERLRTELREAAVAVPDSVSVPAEESADDIAAGRFEVVVAATFPARQVVDYLAEAEVLGPLREDLGAAAARIEEAAEVGREVAQLTAYHIGSLNAPRGAAASEELVATLLRAGVERCGRAIDSLREVREQLDDSVSRRFAALAGRLDGATIHRLAERLPQYLRSRRSRQVLGGVRRLSRDAATGVSEQVVRLVYRRSEGVVLARQLRRDAAAEPASVEPLRRFAESVSPRPDVLDRLPQYYRQLFLGRPTVTDQLRVGFQRELAEAADALAAHRAGAAGALLVLGEPGQGRGTLSGIIAERHAGTAAVFRVDAPAGGSIDPAAFSARLGAALGRTDASPARLAAALPSGSALIVNDLERWWERSAEGGAILDALDELIARTPGDCLVVLNAGPRSFRLINRLRPLDDRILRAIECEPFTASQLRQVILPRHASTGLTFELNGRTEERLSKLRLARLFDAHFDFAQGNVGIALHAWIACIERVDGDVLRIRAPRRPRLDALETLTHVQLMLLIQLLLHGRLTRDRMIRVCQLDAATLARELRGVLRAGLVRERAAGELAVDAFVRPHLHRFLTDRELL